MIIRHIPVKTGKKSSFSRLVHYITSKLGKHERLGIMQINNCQSQTIDWTIEEIQATQALNQRAISDKTYHLLISFPAGEIPTVAILKNIEETVCAAIGLENHQRISAVHHDTDNMHIHVAINKIHPITHRLHEPYLAYKTLGKTAEKLEVKHGLQRTNHTPTKTLSENHANDLEHHTGIESFLSWIRSNCLKEMQESRSWSDFHQVLAIHGLSLKERGNGLVVTNNQGVFVKASTIARDLSKPKLEERFGKFSAIKTEETVEKQFLKEKSFIAKIGKKPPPRSKGRFVYLKEVELLPFSNSKNYINKPIIIPINTDALFKKYTLEMAAIKNNRTINLNVIKRQKMEAIARIKRNAHRKRLAIKLMNEKGASKKILYGLVSKTYKAEIAKTNAIYLESRSKIYTNNQWRTWIDWLKWQAVNENTEALHALRSRAAKKPLTGNTVSGLHSTINIKTAEVFFDGITKSGTIIYHAGNTAIRDDGNTLKVSNIFTETCLKTALEIAVKRYGNTITVNGHEKFKNKILKIVIQSHPDITFSDPFLEKKRQFALKIIKSKEQINAVDRREFKSGRTIGSGIASIARTADRGRVPGDTARNFNKPNLERIGRRPPPESQNRLRTMSELGMVQLTDRGEVLLPGNVSYNLEHQGAESDNRMRRDVSRSGINGLAAAEKYIAERESKRIKGIDIFQHRLVKKEDTGTFEFAGIRIIDSQSLVLLKSTTQIVVYPVEEKVVSKLKKLSLGDKVNLSGNGISLIPGRKLR